MRKHASQVRGNTGERLDLTMSLWGSIASSLSGGALQAPPVGSEAEHQSPTVFVNFRLNSIFF